MYAVEFKAPIENGVVYIPKEYKDLQQNMEATFVVMYEENQNKDKYFDKRKKQLHQLKKDIENGNVKMSDNDEFEKEMDEFEKEMALKYAH
jgi:anti-sigma28 factor (negative regulator of flagellin synthesis)